MSADLRQQALQASLAKAAASGDHEHVLADAEAFVKFLAGDSE